GLTAGFTYSFETCGDSDFDTQITIYDASTGATVTYNDDFCGLQSKATFVSNGNPVRVLIDKYFCTNQSSCMTLRGTLVSGASSYNPCDDATALTCGSTGSFSLNGAGEWNNLGGPWGTPGEEAVYSFTATLTGTHTVSLTNSGYYVDIYYKSGSCGSTGWTYGDDIYTSGSINISMTAGTTYYLLVDDENTSASNGTITVSCPTPAANPCDDITPIASCGSSASFSLSAGNGAWNPPGPWGTPGQEQVFSFTPSISGAYPIQVTNSGYYVDLFYKTGSCNSSGWTYVSDIFSNETNNVNLTAGVTYLFLIDDENTSPSSGSITVGCPCIPPAGGIDESVTVTSNTSYSSTTIGACNDCSLRSSNDRILEVVIPCAGTYTFSTCNNATWDTYLYLTTAPCGGSIIALNDDACGLRSSITASLQPGTYYLAIEGFSAFSQGAFTVDITKSCDLSLSLNANVQGCGFNVSCNGGNDGSVTASTNGCDVSYAWSNGVSSATNSGLGSGYYTLNVADGFGCTASGAIYLTEPTAILPYAGEDQTVYYGYAPEACADLNGSATGGCPEYTYQWSDENGNTLSSGTSDNVCPSESTVYTLSVTDNNGCVQSDDVNICVIDVVCYAGNSGNEKVQVCHRTGNGSSHTLCVDASAVADHLAHGDRLGDCDEVFDCGPVSTAIQTNPNNTLRIEEEAHLELFPNPASKELNIHFDTDLRVASFSIVNALGQLVQTGTINNGNTTLNISSFESGVYYFKVEGHLPVIFAKK
ncbi:T9SS type A sorting domain-containing protein, partial [Crocinitomicaceae bacterium]|nr:T9SS type A sorting domain-containing protein [Crocinitomicaceae bacterium]